jgi:hypothetical protein
MQIEREWLQLGGYLFLEFLKASIANMLHCCFHHYKTLKAGATATAVIVVLTHPPIFTIFEGQNLTFSLYPSLLKLLTKTLQKPKTLPGSM